MHLFDHTTAQHLLPAHSRSPFCRVCLTEILPDPWLRIFIEDLGNLPQLLCVLVIGPEGSAAADFHDFDASLTSWLCRKLVVSI